MNPRSLGLAAWMVAATLALPVLAHSEALSFETSDFRSVKPVDFSVLRSTTMCHYMIPARIYDVFWQPRLQAPVAMSSASVPGLTFTPLEEAPSLNLHKDQFGGSWIGNTRDTRAVLHALTPRHSLYLVGYRGFDCWPGGKDELLGMSVIIPANLDTANALRDSTLRSLSKMERVKIRSGTKDSHEGVRGLLRELSSLGRGSSDRKPE